jgi:Flp pilus assembly protein TadG
MHIVTSAKPNRQGLRTFLKRALAPAISRQEGDSLSEFAVVSVVLFMVVFGIIDCSRALYAYHFVSYAARDGARYAIVRGYTFNGTSCTTVSTYSCAASSTNVTSYVRAIVPPGISSTSLSVNASWPGTAPTGAATSCPSTSTNSPGCLVTVQVSYPYTFSLPFIPQKSMTLSSTASMVIAQ